MWPGFESPRLHDGMLALDLKVVIFDGLENKSLRVQCPQIVPVDEPLVVGGAVDEVGMTDDLYAVDVWLLYGGDEFRGGGHVYLNPFQTLTLHPNSSLRRRVCEHRLWDGADVEEEQGSMRVLRFWLEQGEKAFEALVGLEEGSVTDVRDLFVM